MRKITVLFVVFAAIFAAFLYLYSRPLVCIGLSCVRVELAVTPSQQELGLMYRSGIEGGMLFVFPQEGSYGFWMKGMNFPIDIVWISASREVVGISANVPPCIGQCPIYAPPSPVKYVLEVPANFSMEKGIIPQDKAFFLGI